MVILLIAPVHLRDGIAPDAAEVAPSRAQLTRSRGKRTEVAISVEDGLRRRSTHRLHRVNRVGINDVVSTVQATPSRGTGGLPDSARVASRRTSGGASTKSAVSSGHHETRTDARRGRSVVLVICGESGDRRRAPAREEGRPAVAGVGGLSDRAKRRRPAAGALGLPLWSWPFHRRGDSDLAAGPDGGRRAKQCTEIWL